MEETLKNRTFIIIVSSFYFLLGILSITLDLQSPFVTFGLSIGFWCLAFVLCFVWIWKNQNKFILFFTSFFAMTSSILSLIDAISRGNHIGTIVTSSFSLLLSVFLLIVLMINLFKSNLKSKKDTTTLSKENAESLIRLKELYDKKIITEEEYMIKRQNYVDKL